MNPYLNIDSESACAVLSEIAAGEVDENWLIHAAPDYGRTSRRSPHLPDPAMVLQRLSRGFLRPAHQAQVPLVRPSASHRWNVGS